MLLKCKYNIYLFVQYKKRQNQVQKDLLQAKLDKAIADIQHRNKGLSEQNEQLNSSIKDTNFVINQAVESGDFNARINTNDKEGQWKELSESINNLFDSFL